MSSEQATYHHHQQQQPQQQQQQIGPPHSSRYRKANSSSFEQTTPLVWLVVWSITCAGFLLGYTSGSNVAVSPSFRDLFLPQLPEYRGSSSNSSSSSSPSCDELVYRLSWYLAPRYITGCVAALPVGWFTRVAGRRISLGVGCGVFVLAHLLRGTTNNLIVLLVGQGIDGIASAFLYQAPFLEAAEVSPAKWRGACGYSIQIGRSIGLFCRGLLNQGIANQPSSPSWGWRLAVLFPIWPALVFALLVPLLPETPNSLMQRGQLAAARAALQEIRGPLVDVEQEFDNIMQAAGVQHGQGQSPWSQFRTLVQRRQLPLLVMLLMMCVTREFLGGADFLLQYSQPLNLGLGLEDPNGSGFGLRQIVNGGYLLGAVLGCVLLDTWGRRPVFLISGAGAAASYLVMGAALAAHRHDHNLAAETETEGWLRGLLHAGVILSYTFYAMAWALGFYVLIAEIFPLATRSLAMSVAQGLTYGLYAISSSVGLLLGCRVRFALLWMFGAANVLGTVFVYFCLPETKRLPLEDVSQAFQEPPHWLWKRFYRKSSSSSSKASSGNGSSKASSSHNSSRRHTCSNSRGRYTTA